MKSASLNELKKELQTLDPAQVMELCLKLAKYKKENKELLNYLLFEAHNEEAYIQKCKVEIDELFAEINTSNIYYAKKGIRKTLRTINKYIKYSGHKQTAADLLIYFCATLKESGIPIQSSTALSNLYQMQIKKINAAIESMHEDLQYDYHKEVARLQD